ncbi:MAG: alanine--tRNA ligase [Pseudomonadales bacterium]|nr:alanine--tRNA ligase [Pseudomonadales bacterium]
MQANKLKQLYLDFYKNKNHQIVPSSSIVPENDPTTLFTGSGMQPMMEYFLGVPHPKGSRIVDIQKCFRSQDIEEIGDNRHITFFEMLGNWSFGDYFKNEQLEWLFDFLVNKINLDPKKLFVTVFSGNIKLNIDKDLDSVEIWKKLFSKVGIEAIDIDHSQINGMQAGRIFYFDEKYNWWSRAGVPDNMPAGEPGGPDSEVFYDFGADKKIHENSLFKNQVCHVNCDCGRFLEICNSVFMQYRKQNDGGFIELSQRNVDFGGGFERILAAINDVNDVFMTSIFKDIIEYLEMISNKKYSESEKNKRSFRVVADHLRAAVMLAADGVYPSNKEQGYFSRRLVRRSVRYAKMIGINDLFIKDLVPLIIGLYQDFYPDLLSKSNEIQNVLSQEEKKFAQTIQKGLKEIEKHSVLNGEIAFKLYETHGFPFELTKEIAQEKGQTVSLESFQKAQKAHADLSRSSSSQKFKGGLQDSSVETTRYHTATHLLHAALRKILGKHVEQKGSNITANRLRFDFSHPKALTKEEIIEVENQINAWITESLTVSVKYMKKSEALKSGAIAFFVEKYPEDVTVYTIGNGTDTSWVSRELCGGPHVENTSQIGHIQIFKEQAISNGIRRIYLR